MEHNKINQKQKFEIADILRQNYNEQQWKGKLDFNQQKAFNDILKCRTSLCGGHISKCNKCDHQRQEYNSCRNRNCPKCQFVKQQKWVDKLKTKLLPVKYFHLVFTIPSELRSIFLQNQKQCYDFLFTAATQSIKKTTKSRYGFDVGFIGVLHTWTQTLEYHPHIHFIVTAGGISEDSMEWISVKNKYLVPQKTLSEIFRAILCRLIRESIKKKLIEIPDHIVDYKIEIENKIFSKNWKVFIEKPFKGPNSVVNYLGKYIHRVAISNSRIKSIDKQEVIITCRDNKNKAKPKSIKLTAEQFIKRFSYHIIPSGYYKVRHFGLFASVLSKTKYQQCIALIGKSMTMSKTDGLCGIEICRMVLKTNPWLCPMCKDGTMINLINYNST